jgi:hypothetical protein
VRHQCPADASHGGESVRESLSFGVLAGGHSECRDA